MSTLVVFAKDLIVSLLMISVIIGVIYAIFGRGLAFRIYLVVMPLFATTATGIRLMEQLDSGAVAHGVVSVAMFALNIGGLILLYRITVKPLREYSLTLESSSAQLAATASQSAATASEQSSMSAQLGSTIEEITQMSAAASKRAEEIVAVAANSLEFSREGQTAIREALDIMVQIGRVNQIVDAINNLAEQSNVLAVNAGIEAAKAGEYGKGFAVVASEVRILSEQSADATREIRDALQLTSKGHAAIETASKAIDQLSAVLENSSDRSREIAGSVTQQAAGIQQINDAATSLVQTSQDSAAATKQIGQASAALRQLGGQVRLFIGGKNKK